MSKNNDALHGAGEVLSCPVVKLPDNRNWLEWQELAHGIIILGGNGSGKTSGVGAWMMNDILRDKHKPGMMVLCVKPTERDRVVKMAKAAGRSDDVVIFSKHSAFTVNAMEQELFRNGRQDVNYEHAVDLLIEISTLAENYQAGGASGNGSDDRYWVSSMKLRIKRLLMLLVLSGEAVTITNMRRAMIDSFSEEDVIAYVELRAIIQSKEEGDQDDSASESEDEKLSEREKAEQKKLIENAEEAFDEWCENNYFLRCFERANTQDDLTHQEKETMFLVADYFLKEYPFIGDKTRSIVDSSISALFESFTTGILKSHFDGKMSAEVKPERCAQEGKIIIVDFPLAEFGLSAVMAMGICKKLFQLTQQRRRIDKKVNPRPVVLWVDEAHLVINATSDEKFQSICRETLTACVYITQSVNSLKIAMGTNGEIKTKALLTNLGTVFACRNLCRDSNVYIANLIGKAFLTLNNTSFDTNDKGSKSTNQQFNYVLPPEHMVTLKSGGTTHNFKVEAIAVVGGKQWSTGENFLECTFDQRGRSIRKVNQIFSLVKSLFI